MHLLHEDSTRYMFAGCLWPAIVECQSFSKLGIYAAEHLMKSAKAKQTKNEVVINSSITITYKKKSQTYPAEILAFNMIIKCS